LCVIIYVSNIKIGLVRQNVSIFWKFIDLGGIKLVVNALKSSNDKMQIKGMFLIYSTCHMGNDVAGNLLLLHSVVNE